MIQSNQYKTCITFQNYIIQNSDKSVHTNLPKCAPYPANLSVHLTLPI